MRVQIDGVRIFFDVVGPRLDPAGPSMEERPTLIVLHGGPGADHSIYRPEFDTLAEVAQVVYVDHRGQGRSDRGAPSDWTLDRWADDLRALCDALDIERPVVLGHSFGGMVAMAYATRYPSHPGKLVLSCTYARQNLERTVERCRELGGDDVAAAARAMWEQPDDDTMRRYDQLVAPYYLTRELDRTALIDGYRRVRQRREVARHFMGGEMKRFDLRSDLARIECPTLVIGASRDPVCLIEDAEEIAAALPRGRTRYERFEGSSHAVWFDEPERYFGLIREFLENAPDESG